MSFRKNRSNKFQNVLNKKDKTNKWLRTAQQLKSPLTGKAKSEGAQAGTKRSSQRGIALLTIYTDIFLALDASEALNFLLFFELIHTEEVDFETSHSN